MIQSNQPLCRSRLYRSIPWASRQAPGLVLAATGLLSVVLAGGCADPLMRRSQLPDTIDYSGGSNHQAPELPTQPTTAPSAEILKPASLPATAPIAPATLPSETAPPATGPAELVPATLPTVTPVSSTTKPGL